MSVLTFCAEHARESAEGHRPAGQRCVAAPVPADITSPAHRERRGQAVRRCGGLIDHDRGRDVRRRVRTLANLYGSKSLVFNDGEATAL